MNQLLESRLATLEAQVPQFTPRMDRFENKLDNLTTVTERLATLEERVRHLPSKEAMWGTAILIVTAITAVITFQGAIQGFVGMTPSSGKKASMIVVPSG